MLGHGHWEPMRLSWRGRSRDGKEDGSQQCLNSVSCCPLCPLLLPQDLICSSGRIIWLVKGVWGKNNLFGECVPPRHCTHLDTMVRIQVLGEEPFLHHLGRRRDYFPLKWFIFNLFSCSVYTNVGVICYFVSLWNSCLLLLVGRPCDA